MTGKPKSPQDQRRANEPNLGQKDAQQQQESDSEMQQMGEESKQGESRGRDKSGQQK